MFTIREVCILGWQLKWHFAYVFCHRFLPKILWQCLWTLSSIIGCQMQPFRWPTSRMLTIRQGCLLRQRYETSWVQRTSTRSSATVRVFLAQCRYGILCVADRESKEGLLKFNNTTTTARHLFTFCFESTFKDDCVDQPFAGGSGWGHNRLGN